MGVAKKALSPSIQVRTAVKGVSGTLIEYIRSGIRFIKILPIFRHHFLSIYDDIMVKELVCRLRVLGSAKYVHDLTVLYLLQKV